ncbi:GYD domain-containing protein [Ramlibacter algicola]|uniref:GYD domain-containing protein n=1 Tax=Ramlibacter algicola TaxID=2795217 RepID=A0A934US77_9BURK|nr:GYD domain-containing protein [Ramlibacter algicola]MBK0393940.1 GYD domain-containing protein [Ramlibacter algicola]
MATYITLGKFTEQGMRGIRETTSRADAVREQAKKAGIEMKSIHWTQGKYDMVVLWEAPDEKAFATFGLTIGKAGNVRFQTMRAFTRDEMGDILAKLG